MVGRDAPELGVGGVRSDAVEEGADFPLPAFEVCTQDRDLVVVWQFDRSKALCAPTEEQAALALGAEVSDPLRMPAWRDEVARALESQHIDRSAAGLAGLASADFEDAGSRDAQSDTSESATARLNTCVMNQARSW
jgi:hypothetical protein